MKGLRAHVLQHIADNDPGMSAKHCATIDRLLQTSTCAMSACCKITPDTKGQKVWCFSVTLLDRVRLQYVQHNEHGIGFGIQDAGLPAGQGVYIRDSSLDTDLQRAGEALDLNDTEVMVRLYIYIGKWLFKTYAGKTLEKCCSPGGFIEQRLRINKSAD